MGGRLLLATCEAQLAVNASPCCFNWTNRSELIRTAITEVRVNMRLFFKAENITITEIKRGVLENRYNLFGIIKIANHFETG